MSTAWSPCAVWGAPRTTLWFCLPAIAVLVLPIFARRRFPFAGPALYWLVGAGITFVDGLLIPYANALFGATSHICHRTADTADIN